MTIRVPRKFFDDHVERDLPSPKILRETKNHYFIPKNDEAVSELLSDADYYAEMRRLGGLEPGLGGLAMSAEATARAIRAATIN